jgi:hypothetical protein
MLESARGVNPTAEDDMARKARQVSSWGDFNGLEFAVEIGIEKDKTGQYGDKNKILKVITPDHKNYQRVMDGETIMPDGVKATKGGGSPPPPAWAPQKKSDPVPAWAQ